MKKINKQFRALEPGIGVTSINRAIFRPTMIVTNQVAFKSSCVNCLNTPCILLGENEVRPRPGSVLHSLPYNPDKHVCVTDAIRIDEQTFFPTIREACIGCSICVMRCPVGAIFIDWEHHTARIVHDDRHYVQVSYGTSQYEQTLNVFRENSENFDPPEVPPGFLSRLSETVERLAARSLYVDTILVRNLLLQLGVSCLVRPVGDTNVRMDLYFELDGLVGVGEVEGGRATVSALRALLDDVAVLSSRHKVDVDSIEPFIFCNYLPDKRSDYFDLVNDVEKVLNLRIHTMTLTALLLLYWHRKKLTESALRNNFVALRGKEEIMTDLERILGTSLSHLPIPPGLLVSKK